MTGKFGDLCFLCRRKEFCKDKVMVAGINKLIEEVAPNLKLACDKYDFSLSNDNQSGPGFIAAQLTKEAVLQ